VCSRIPTGALGVLEAAGAYVSHSNAAFLALRVLGVLSAAEKM
jgi:hypothetical protein